MGRLEPEVRRPRVRGVFVAVRGLERGGPLFHGPHVAKPSHRDRCSGLRALEELAEWYRARLSGRHDTSGSSVRAARRVTRVAVARSLMGSHGPRCPRRIRELDRVRCLHRLGAVEVARGSTRSQRQCSVVCTGDHHLHATGTRAIAIVRLVECRINGAGDDEIRVTTPAIVAGTHVRPVARRPRLFAGTNLRTGAAGTSAAAQARRARPAMAAVTRAT